MAQTSVIVVTSQADEDLLVKCEKLSHDKSFHQFLQLSAASLMNLQQPEMVTLTKWSYCLQIKVVNGVQYESLRLAVVD